jgi:hypothetical protein
VDFPSSLITGNHVSRLIILCLHERLAYEPKMTVVIAIRRMNGRDEKDTSIYVVLDNIRKRVLRS